MRQCLAWKYLIKRISLLFIATFILFPVLCLSASKDECARTIRVVDYFHEIENKYNIKLSYSISMWKNMDICVKEEPGSLQQLLQDLPSQLPLNIKIIDENNYLIIPVKSTIAFKLTDESTNEPISLAYVSINSSKNKLLFTNGQFYDMSGILPSDQFNISTSFYKSTSVSASEILNGQNEIALERKVFDINELIVLPAYMTRGIDSKLNDQSIRIDIPELSSIAGETDGDVYQVLKALPGISSPSGKPGSIIIRGNLFQSNLIQFDGIPVYHQGHLAGAFSPFNPGIIKNVDVYRNGVPIEYGGKAGSMVDLKTKDDLLNDLEVSLLSNLVYSGVTLSMPVVKNKLGILISARSSMPFLNESAKLQAVYKLSLQGTFPASGNPEQPNSKLDQSPFFSDVNAKIIYQPNTKNTFSVSSILISNRKPKAGDKLGVIAFDNYGLSAKWQAKWTSRLNSELSAITSRYLINSDSSNAESMKIISTYTMDDLKLNLRTNYSFNSNNKISGGYNLSLHDIGFVRSLNGSVTDDSLSTGQVHSFYLKYETVFKSNLIASIGLRENYYHWISIFKSDAHINLTYLYNKDLFFKASLSQEHQYLNGYLGRDFNNYMYFAQYLNFARNEGDIAVGRHAMFGAVYKKGKWLVDIEFYINNTSNVANEKIELPAILPQPPVGQDGQYPSRPGNIGPLPLPGDGGNTTSEFSTLHTKGIDFLIKKKWNQIDTWVSYTLSHSYLDDNSSSNVYFDRLHDISVTGIIPLGRWAFSINWNFATGLPVLPILFRGTPEQRSLINIPYTDRFPSTHQLDLSVTCKLLNKMKHIEGVLGLSVLNVYNQKNIVNNFFQVEDINDLYRYGIGFAPNIQLELRFK